MIRAGNPSQKPPIALGQRRSAPPGAETLLFEAESFCGEEWIGHLMQRITMSMRRQAARRLTGRGITEAQCTLLLRIKLETNPEVTALARSLGMGVGAMTRLLDRMERKGLCKRTRSSQDRRVVNVQLSPQGAASFADAPGVLAQVMDAHLAGFSNSERLALRSFLERMLVNAGRLQAPS